MQQLELFEPGSEHAVATGLLIPHGIPSNGGSGTSATPLGLTAWFTGLSGAGKSTIAREVRSQLCHNRVVEWLDADVVRTYLCKDLGYSQEDRTENVKRLGFIANQLTKNGVIVLVSAISPYRDVRDWLRKTIGQFVEVYVNASIAVCEERDVKGLYTKVRAGEIYGFTGIDDSYEPPLSPEVECFTGSETIAISASKVIAAIIERLNG